MLYNAETINQVGTLATGDLKTNLANAENSKRKMRVNEEKDKALALAREGKPAPLGNWIPSHLKYNFDTKQYDVNEPVRATMQRVFEEYMSGKGAMLIARGLNADNIPSFKGGKWAHSSVVHLLSYEGVIGVLNIKGERIAGAFPPAISENLFYQVQAKLESHVHPGGGASRSENVLNVFRGLCKCSKCQSGVYVKQGYLGCKGSYVGKCEHKTRFPWNELERELIAWLVPTAKDALLGVNTELGRVNALEAQQKALTGKINDTIALLDVGLAVNEVKARLEKLTAERQTVEANLQTALASTATKTVLPDNVKALESLIDGANMGDNAIRKQIASVVPSIVKRIDVDLKFRETPSAKVTLTDGQVLNWSYKWEEVIYPIEADSKTRLEGFPVGKPVVVGGSFERV